MENVIAGIMIGVGIVLLLVLQGMVLASLSEEREQDKPKPETRNHISMMDILKSILPKISLNWHHFK
ncbi:MAG: hypothetical protein HGB06_03320 [Chlorobaculum sp.]|nr:hypothetical protein [Chlorobaculum sp.]